MNPDFDLVILDLDGTILDPAFPGGISAGVRETIAMVQAAGVPVTIATGRTLEYVRACALPLNIATPVVTTQGAIVGDPVSGHVLLETTIPLEQARAVAAWADATERISAFFFFDGDGRTHIRQNVDYGERGYYDHLMGSPREFVGPFAPLLAGERPHPPVKYMMLSDERTEPGLQAALQERFGAGITVSRTHTLLLEITAAGVDKGAGVLHLCDHLKIDPARVLAIGDNDNDIPMLQVTGYAVAMGNASIGALAAADWVAPSIDEDGVAVALRRLVLGQA